MTFWYKHKETDAWTPTKEARPRIESGFYEFIDYPMAGFKKKDAQSDELIDLPGTVVDELYNDIMSFMECKQRYAKCGLMHKRGYMLYGPPGGGKTSVAQLLARRFVKATDGVAVYVSSYSDLINSYDLMYNQERDRETIFLIEECDSFIDNPGALGLLDGEQSACGKVFVAMSNYVDNMPPRIVNRPGRFDRVIEVKAPHPKVQEEYLRRIRARDIGASDEIPNEIVSVLDGISITLAHLREAYVAHVILKQPLVQVAARFREMQLLSADAE